MRPQNLTERGPNRSERETVGVVGERSQLLPPRRICLPDVARNQDVKRSDLPRGVIGVIGAVGRGVLDPDNPITEVVEGLRVLGGEPGGGERGGDVRAGRRRRDRRQRLAGWADGNADQGFLGEVHVRHGLDGEGGGAVIGRAPNDSTQQRGIVREEAGEVTDPGPRVPSSSGRTASW